MEEIIRRLRSRDNKSLRALKESMPVQGLNEVDEDEEDITLDEPEVDTEVEETPDDMDTELDTGSGEDMDFRENPTPTPPEDDYDEESEDEVTPDTLSDEELEDPENTTNVNPLDNSYAVNFSIGQEVVLSYANGTKSKLRGVIDGYDPEGFYRIKWSHGLTTNGITDLALLDFIESTEESTCICGNSEYVTEGDKIVCDKCGRIRESSDPLTIADKSRPRGKRLIRSEAHPISTTLSESKPKTIQDSIRAVIGSKKIKEDTENTILSDLKSLEGEFWTRVPELVSDIEELGYVVEDFNSEYVVVSIDDYDEEILIPIGGTSRTMTLDFDRARVL